jgi:hypothetical protein
MLPKDSICLAVAVGVTLNSVGFLTACAEVFPLVGTTRAVLVVLGTNQSALGIVEHPLISPTVAVGIELTTDEDADALYQPSPSPSSSTLAHCSALPGT